MKVVVKKDGEVIAEIPLVVDLQEPKEEKEKKSKPISFSFWWILLILVVLVITYLTLVRRGAE